MEVPRTVKFIDRKSRSEAPRSWEWGGWESMVMGTEFQIGKMGKFWRGGWWGWLHHRVNVPKPLSCTLKNDQRCMYILNH